MGEMKKCSNNGCYNPSECRHGKCKDHCHKHEELSYNSRYYPYTDEKHMGVEIEVEFDNYENKKRAIPLQAHGDGSLGQYGAEFKILTPSRRIARKCASVLQDLWIRRAKITRRCGIHVHIDIRKISYTRRAEVLKWLQATQDYWFTLVPASRRNNTYVAKIGTGANPHYIWAHTTPYDTIEIRLHPATLNPFKLAGWLSAMVHLQNKIYDESFKFETAPAEENAASVLFWQVYTDAPKEAKEYLKTRAAANGVIRDYAFDPMPETHEGVEQAF